MLYEPNSTSFLPYRSPVFCQHSLNTTHPQNYFQGRLCPKAPIVSTAEKGRDGNYSGTHYTNAFRKQANSGKIPGGSRGQGEKRQRKVMLRPLPGHCWQGEPSTISLLSRCLLTLQLQLLEWMAELERAEEKTGEFCAEENKHRNMERRPSAKGADEAAGSRVTVKSARLQVSTFQGAPSSLFSTKQELKYCGKDTHK